jgi:transposase
MPKRYSLDLRKRVIEAVNNGMTQCEAAKIFSVSYSTIYNWLNLQHETGSLEPKPNNFPNRLKITKPIQEFIINLVKNKSDITLLEIKDILEEEINFIIDDSNISRFLKKAGFTRKKNGMLQLNS